MVLGEALTDAEGQVHAMAGLLPLETSFADRKLHLGYRNVKLSIDTPLGAAQTAFGAHEFHYAGIIREDSPQALCLQLPMPQAEDLVRWGFNAAT